MNYVLIVVVLLIAFKVYQGFKKGMVKEIISLVTLAIVGIMVALLACALHTYMQKEIVGLIVAVLLLGILGIVHQFLGFIFFSAKMISKLPVVSLVNKLLGAVFGFGEAILIVMLIYFFIDSFGLGVLGAQIQEYTAEVAALQYIYDHNILSTILQDLVVSIKSGMDQIPDKIEINKIEMK